MRRSGKNIQKNKKTVLDSGVITVRQTTAQNSECGNGRHALCNKAIT